MSNRSLAVWCPPKPSAVQTEIEAHFNYWRISGHDDEPHDGERYPDFIEIGILIDDVQQIDSICIFLPLIVSYAEINDCSPKFLQPDLAQGIFNEVLGAVGSVSGGPPCIELKKTGGIFARVHRFVVSGGRIDASQLALSEEEGGTMLTITTTALENARKCAISPAPSYFRLRVSLPLNRKDNPFVRIVPNPDRHFQSGFDEIEYLDFRMNEARTLPPHIEDSMSRSLTATGAVKFRLVAFLTAVPVRSEMSSSNTPSHKMRLLEHDLWRNYADGIPDGMIVYHWKRESDKREIKDFSAFIKLQTRRSGAKILLCYLAIAFAVGIMGNLCASGIEALAPHFFSTQPPAVTSTIEPGWMSAGQRPKPAIGNGP